MNWNQAYDKLKAGYKVKRRDWKGYWVIENGTIMIYCKDNSGHEYSIDIRDTEDPLFTFGNMAENDWVITVDIAITKVLKYKMRGIDSID